MKAPTIYDVARRAGVSHQTVTRYLQGYAGMRPETRDRVEAALKELDYRPNTAARLLRSRKTNRIGVLADRIGERGPSRVLAGAGAVAQGRGYVLDIVTTDGSSAGSVASSLATLIGHQVAGILATAHTQVVLDELERQATTTPLLVSPRAEDPEGRPATNELAGRCMAEHLLGLGHRRVGYVSGPDLWLAARGRTSGFAQRIREGGGEVVWVREGDWSPASGHAAWQGLDDTERKVTAVGVADDSMAIGLLAAMLDGGVDVPGSVSVIGTDDLPEARYVRPSLSTVVLDFEDEGRFLIERLLEQIEPSALIAAEPQPPRLIARASTGPAPVQR